MGIITNAVSIIIGGLVGNIVKKKISVKKFAVGDIVTGHISRSFASHVITGTQGLVKIPRTEKPVEFCLGEPLSCVTNIVRATQAEYGDSIAVIGCGVMAAGLTGISAAFSDALLFLAMDIRYRHPAHIQSRAGR